MSNTHETSGSLIGGEWMTGVPMTARESSECAICGRALTPDAPIVKTGEVIFDCHDPLWRFSDSGIHATCFRDWAGPAHVESVRT